MKYKRDNSTIFIFATETFNKLVGSVNMLVISEKIF